MEKIVQCRACARDMKIRVPDHISYSVEKTYKCPYCGEPSTFVLSPGRTIQCPECNSTIEISIDSDSLPGDYRSVKCPHCKKDVEYQINRIGGVGFSKSYQCPVCGSENIQRLSLVWKGGTANWDGSAVGVGIGSGGVGGGVALMGGTSQTLLADDAAPPRKVSPCTVLFAIAIAAFGTFMFTDVARNSFMINRSTEIFWIVFVTGAVALYFILNTIQYNKAYPKKIKQWYNSFLCLRCGAKFIVRT